jgi:hypothetical protein
MTALVENPYLILIGGLLLVALFVVLLVQSGRGGFLYAALGSAALCLALLLVERLVVTEREQVEAALDGLAAALETNEVPKVLEFLAPDAPRIRSEAEARLPGVEIQHANVGGDLRITINELASPPSATATFTGRIHGKDRSGVFPYENYVRRFTVQLRQQNGRWLLYDYQEAAARGAPPEP